MKSLIKNITMAAMMLVPALSNAANNNESVTLTAENAQQEAKSAYTINRFADNPYLAEIWWGDDYDAQKANTMLKSRYNQPADSKEAKEMGTGGCSSWHKDNFHGRNIDWTMKDFATVIVHMPKNEAKGVKYASVGLVAGNPAFTRSFIENNDVVPEKYRSFLPATIIDGINEKGLAINHNIVPYDGATYESNGDVTSVALCRYILDNCATADEAVELMKNTKVTQAIVKIANDYSHFFVSDPTCSYVFEWINGEFIPTKFTADGKGNFISPKGEQAIMTNYFVAKAEEYGLGTNDFYKNHSTAAGVERTDTIAKQLSSIKGESTLQQHLDICKSVWYRQFCQGKTTWATENAGNYGYDETIGKAYWAYPTPNDIHWMQNDDVYSAAKAMLNSQEMQGYYNDFNTNWDKCDPANTYWYTQHSVVYDLSQCKGYIVMQEGMYSQKVVEVSVK